MLSDDPERLERGQMAMARFRAGACVLCVGTAEGSMAGGAPGDARLLLVVHGDCG